MLREDELRQLEALDERAVPMLSPACQELLKRSLDSLDYSGNWSDPTRMRDSMVLSCKSPEVLDGPGGPEYSCRFDEFTQERHELHEHIVERMLASPKGTGFTAPDGGRVDDAVDGGSIASWQRGAARGAAKRSLGEQYEARPAAPAATDAAAAAVQAYEHETGSLSYTGLASLTSSSLQGEQHVFIVVGVPGSGKDSVLKRYVRSLGMDLLDASADRVKEYLAAYGTDELSVSVREHNLAHGPGKHLLHAQYLHRESVFLIDDIVKRAMTQRRSLLLEKTLFDSGHVLEYARRFAAEGCRTHLLGTHITPLRNWEFLSNRMSSGQSFGRYISKAQAITSLRQYDANLRSILDSPCDRAVFDSIHVFDVRQNNWCVAWTPGDDDDDYADIDDDGAA